MSDELSMLWDKPALQQPVWIDQRHVGQVRKELASKPPLVRGEDVHALRCLLARVAAGQLHVVQSGDCSEDPSECTSGHVARKAALLDVLAGIIKMITYKPVLRVGRIAGRFSKPRSKPIDLVGGIELPVYRGHMVNCPEPDLLPRRPDPSRLLAGYRAASDAMRHLGWHDSARRSRVEAPVWTSHEALLLDYEIPMLRRDDNNRPLLTSTHWPWVGDVVADRLPPLVAAVRAAGHPVVWLTDPMHGNTISSPGGLKTRFLETIVREVENFQSAVSAERGVAGGLHLETTPDDVAECVANESMLDQVGVKYTSFCDPRLNLKQAVSVVSAWRG